MSEPFAREHLVPQRSLRFKPLTPRSLLYQSSKKKKKRKIYEGERYTFADNI